MAYEDEKKGELETLLNDILEDKNTNLTPENLKKGVTVLGIDGNYIGTDTSDATATNEDVLEGKTAYAQGQKLTGTLRVEDVDSVLDMFPSIETEISEEIDIKDAVENSFNDLSIYGNSRQESTTGKNLVYEIKSGYLTTVENQEATTTEGSEFGNWQINFKNKDGSTSISLEAGEYYVSLDLKINSGSVSNPLNLIAVSEKDGQETINNPVPTTKYQRYCFKSIFNSAKNVNNIIIQKHYDEEVCSFKIKNVMISKMSDYIYEPYTGGNPSPNPDYPQEIESIKDSITFKRIGKNIFNKNNDILDDFYIDPNNKKLTYSIYGHSIIVRCKTNTDYTISRKTVLARAFMAGSIAELPIDGTPLINVITGQDKLNITINSGDNAKYLVVYVLWASGANLQDILDSIQIEEGSVSTEYEPYHENEYTINLNTDLNSINILSKQLEYNYVDEDGNKYLCDVIDFKNKKIIKYLNKIILPKENITWTQNKDETDFFEIVNFYILNLYQARGDLAISNYFRDDRYKSNYIVANKGTVFIRFPKFSGIDTLQKAQEFMDTHDVEVLYVLAKPKEIDLTDEELSYLEQLPLQKGINHIYSDDELSPKFKLKYYRDINMMLESEIINNAESKFNIFYDSKVEEFNTNADEKLKGYNTNADNKLEKYNTNATSKINEYDTNADEKLKGYNTNATSKINEYNTNATNKINEYNTNANEKLEEFNSNADEKVTEFNNNATEKTTAYNNNAEDKLSEYNTNATNKISEYNTNAEAILKILPKTETEVLEEIDIDDAGESSFNKLSVFGNSRQESTTGAAKVDFGAFAGDYSDEQMEIKIDENGIISLKGTVSAYYSKKIGTITKNMFSAGNNIYYARSNNTNNGVIFIQAIGSISFVSNNNSPSFEITDESQESDLYVVVNYLESGTLNVNEILYPMISLESNALYEPYTGGNLSPNPDYPQEIESIGNRDTFLLEKDAKLKQYINAKINQSFALGESERTKVFQNVLKVKSGKKYTIAWTKNTVLDNVVRQCVITNDSNIVVQEFMITPDTEQCLFTANADGMLSIGLDLNSTAVKISKEYGEITFKRIGKNIFNKNNDILDDFYIDPLNKKIVYSIYGNSVIVKCKANINYTVSRKSILVKDFVVGSVAEYPVDGTPTINIVNGRDKLNITINSGENAKYLVAYIMWSNEGSLQDVLDSIQIEEDSVSTEYEPYNEDVYTLPVQQNMYALVEGQEDCFVKKDDGKWYERHYSFEGILDEETYNIDPAGGAIYNLNEFGFPKSVYTKETKQYLNYFKFNRSWSSIKGTAHYSGNNLWINYFDNRESVNQFIKAKKEEGNPLKIVYIRGETNGSILYPLDLECTPEQTAVLNKLEQFSLSKGINHIFSDDELSPKFKLMYYQDMNILLDKINKNIADVSAQLIEGGSNV